MIKRSTILGLLLGGCISLSVFSSCTRDFICECVLTYEGKPGIPASLPREYPITDTKQNAKKTCEAASRTYEENGILTHEDCKLF